LADPEGGAQAGSRWQVDEPRLAVLPAVAPLIATKTGEGDSGDDRPSEGVSRRPHGLFATHKDQFNTDLLDFIRT
jgi:hypothetical protein